LQEKLAFRFQMNIKKFMSKEKNENCGRCKRNYISFSFFRCFQKSFPYKFLIKKFEFIAPELLLKEVRKREESLIKEIGISKKEWNEILNFILEEIDFIPADEFIDFLPEAKKIAKIQKIKNTLP